MFWDLILPLFIPAALVLFFRILNKPYKPAIFGVYQQRNKFFWIKYIFMYLILSFRQLVNHIRRILAVETGKSSDGVQHVHKQDEVLENKYYLGDHAQGIDAVYLNGCNKDGDAVICGIARRPKHVVDAFLFLKVKGEDLLLSPELPDTYQEQVTIEEGYYRVKGLEIANFIPMRTWKLTYNGDMKVRNDTEKTVKVELELTWSAVFSHFNYDTQMSPKSMARDLAKEKWSRGYFKLLKKFHQTHYEQMGVLEGTVTIDGKDHTIYHASGIIVLDPSETGKRSTATCIISFSWKMETVWPLVQCVSLLFYHI
ncbi:unnamed protein product [Spodoptera littoralis]|uniref:Uncharacterized protein n=1 Tax=Spodoptera littoralis TaxID=7109 RepID=A0A9P0IGT8_SPOLI|nr:unnamed protein product [Spodoptera littoralis]CAH1645567.1 unnamed protein product [Spodoptera littoralis]